MQAGARPLRKSKSTLRGSLVGCHQILSFLHICLPNVQEFILHIPFVHYRVLDSIRAELRQHLPGCPKKRKRTWIQQRRRLVRGLLAPFWTKKWPTWLQVGLQNRSKIDKKSMQKSIVFLMPLGVDLWTNFVDFSSQNGAKLVPK